MKKILILIILLAAGGFTYKLTNFSSQEDNDQVKRSSRWSNAHISPKGRVDHSDHKKSSKTSSSASSNGNKPSPKDNSGSSGKTLKNPFFQSPEELNDITWEQAKEFAFREIDFKPQGEEEASLLEANRMMAATYMVPDSHVKLIEYYDSKGLKADIAKDSNPYTGTMITVRTEKSLPGTRYNHTQYFTNENNVAFMQHTSIEYRPGPNAFERTQKMVEKLYGVEKGRPSPNGLVMNYKLGKGQILWVQKMQEKDLKGNPFNAYEATDIGTIRMAIEQEIHPEEEGHDHVGD